MKQGWLTRLLTGAAACLLATGSACATDYRIDTTRVGELDTCAVFVDEDGSAVEGIGQWRWWPDGASPQTASGFGLGDDGAGWMRTTSAATRDGIALFRAVKVTAEGVHYTDIFVNFTSSPRRLRGFWAGTLARGKHVTQAATGRGLRFLESDPAKGDAAIGELHSDIAGSDSDCGLFDWDGGSARTPVRYPGPDQSRFGQCLDRMLAPGEIVVALSTLRLGEPAERRDPDAPFHVQLAELSPALRDCRLSRPRQERCAFSPVERSTAELRAAIVRGAASHEGIALNYLARIAAYDRSGPGLRAFLTVGDVLTEARRADRAIAEGQPAGLLAGSFVAVKDNIAVAGLPLTFGALPYRDVVPARDAAVVARLRAAGAIVIGKTNLDEFALSGFGRSGLGGQTRNVFAPDYGPAGSSAGSAVAVSANLATLALGTDTCDSLSNPSAYASLATIRATQGSVPKDGTLPYFAYHDITGPMARTLADVEKTMALLQGRAPTESAPAVLQQLRIGVLEDSFGTAETGTALAGAVRQGLAIAAGKGVTLVPITLDLAPRFEQIYDHYVWDDFRIGFDAFLASEAPQAPRFDALLEPERKVQLLPLSRQHWLRVKKAGVATAAQRARLAREMADLARLFVKAMDRRKLDAIIYPSALAPPSHIDMARYPIGNCEQSAWSGLPQVSLPVGTVAGEGQPVGASILGRPGDETRLLSIAKAFETLWQGRRVPSTTP